MQVFKWLGDNWFSFVQSVGIIGSLLFSGFSFRNLRSEEHTSNLLAIKQQHDDLWRAIFDRPELLRVLDPRADLEAKPVTSEENFFVLLAIAHLSTACRVLLTTDDEPGEAVRNDIRWFFSLPIPRAIWEKNKARQDPAFIRFVEACKAGTS
jgi:hypothetical protein